MKFNLILLLCISTICVVCSASTSSSKANDVIVLTPDNLEVLNKGEWFFEIYAPWCGFCKRLEPIYDKLAARLKGVTNVGKLDGDAYQQVTMQFRVGGFPTIFFIKDGEIRIYEGERTEDAMAAYAQGKYKSTDPMSWMNSPIHPVGVFLGKVAAVVISGIQLYNKLNTEDGIPQVVLVLGLAIALFIFAFILMEVGTFIAYLILYAIYGKPKPDPVRPAQPKKTEEKQSKTEDKSETASPQSPSAQKRKTKPKKDD